MKCERAAQHRRVALSHFGGCGGTSSPHKKNSLSEANDFDADGDDT